MAAHCQVEPMSVSQVVHKLDAKGLVSRTSHPDDPRAKALTLTDKGVAALGAALREIDRMDTDFFAAADRGRLSGELLRVYQAGRAAAAPAGGEHG